MENYVKQNNYQYVRFNSNNRDKSYHILTRLIRETSLLFYSICGIKHISKDYGKLPSTCVCYWCAVRLF